jgi:hypothetical protein
VAKVPEELGPQTGVIQRRSAIGGLEWGGMHPDADPGSIPENRFRALINVRRKGGNIVPRGGQATIGDLDDLAGNQNYGTWFDIGSARRVYMLATGGCLGVGNNQTGLSVYAIDTEQSPIVQNVTFFLVAKYHTFATLASFDGRLYLSEENRLRRITQVGVPFGSSREDVAATGTDQVVKAFTSFPYITRMIGFDGQLFIALGGLGAGNAKIVSYDGTAFYDELTTINDVLGMTVYGDQLIVSYGGTPNHIRVRPTGAAGVSWATIAPGAGNVGMHRTGVSFRGKAYWVGLATTTPGDIWQFDGTAVSKARTLAGAIDLCTFAGHLYYLRETGATLGHFDGTTWTDSVKALSADRTGAAVAGYRQHLYVAQYKPASHIVDNVLQLPGPADGGPFSTSSPEAVGDFAGTNLPVTPRQFLVL